MVGTSVYCKVAPPSVVGSSRSEGETDNDNDDDRINVRNIKRKNIKMTPEERKEYISSLLVVKVSKTSVTSKNKYCNSPSNSNLKQFRVISIFFLRK